MNNELSGKKTDVKKDFKEERKFFETEVKKFTRKLSGLSTYIMNEK